MKKFLLSAFITILTVSTANAHVDKLQHCPNSKNIHIIKLQKPWTFIYYGYNQQGKYFVSDEQKYNENNGPAPTVFLNKDLSKYNSEMKKLSCIYYIYSDQPYPALVNIGDY